MPVNLPAPLLTTSAPAASGSLVGISPPSDPTPAQAQAFILMTTPSQANETMAAEEPLTLNPTKASPPIHVGKEPVAPSVSVSLAKQPRAETLGTDVRPPSILPPATDTDALVLRTNTVPSPPMPISQQPTVLPLDGRVEPLADQPLPVVQTAANVDRSPSTVAEVADRPAQTVELQRTPVRPTPVAVNTPPPPTATDAAPRSAELTPRLHAHAGPSNGQESATSAVAGPAVANPQLPMPPNVTGPPQPAMSVPTPPADAVDQVRAAVMSRGQQTKIEIQLDPPELGRVVIELDVTSKGNVRAVVSALDIESLDLLRRHASEFAGDLRDQGFDDVDVFFAEDQPAPKATDDSETPPKEPTPDGAPPRTQISTLPLGSTLNLSL